MLDRKVVLLEPTTIILQSEKEGRHKLRLASKKLNLVSLPEHYKLPEGMVITIRAKVALYTRSYLRDDIEPAESYFYLGEAWGKVERGDVTARMPDTSILPCLHRELTITVQGTNPNDTRNLFERILATIHKGKLWEVTNHLK
ncbi:hypothetical protein D6779_03615 [Candidatus Parcubacteria bacterium]|nr:MAG: hypothetical protein D6779_03615 [Candidatus Parcubacteria bacterium]